MARLEDLVEELAELYERRAFHEMQRLRTEVITVHLYVEQGSSIAAAERMADFASLEDRLALVDLDAKIAALLLRKELAVRESTWC